MTIFITGPGRAGTSFLVQLLTRLDFDTGYKPYIYEGYIPEVRAGCEYGLEADIFELYSHEEIRRIWDEQQPRIIKGPVWAYLLKYLLIHNLVEIEHVIMPMRDLTDSALSRLDAGLDFMIDEDFLATPVKTVEEIQENILAMLVGKVLEVCYVYQIPLTLMRFPRMVQDEEYCFGKVVELGEINRDRFRDVYRKLARPEQVKWDQGTLREQVGHPT